MTDPEISTMIGNSKRGGLAFVCAKRYAQANIKHIGENYESQKEPHILHSWMLTTPCGWAIVEFVLGSVLKCETCFEAFRTVLESPDESEKVYFAEAD
jgi:hypothetical protein